MNTDPTIVNTVEENASDFIDKFNLLLAEYGVVDEDGNPAIVNKLAGSPTWLLALAQGQNSTEWQERLRKAYYSIDIENCSEEQVYVLATLAGVLFKEQSAPMITLAVTNPSSTENLVLNSSNCVATDSFAENEWYPGFAYTIPAEQTANIVFYCRDKSGAVPPSITFILKSLDNVFEDITINSTSSSTVLFEGETSAELRNRILQGTSAFDQKTQAQKAIENLNGIVKCSIFFNPSATSSMTLSGGVELPPRTAYIVIKGVDTDNLIAYTYFKYMDVQTLETETSLSSSALVGASTLPVYYDQTNDVYPYIRITIHLSAGAQNTYSDYIKDLIMVHANELELGQILTSQKVDYWIDEGNKYGLLLTSELSTDGNTWQNQFVPFAQSSIVILRSNISFRVVSI